MNLKHIAARCMVGIGLASATLVPSSAYAQEITLRMGLINVPPTAYGTAAAQVPERIAKATNGRVKVELLPTLIPGGQLASAVRDGRIDMVAGVDNYLSGEEPRLNVGQLPGLIRSVEDYRKIYDAYLKDVVRDTWKTRYNATLLTHGLWFHNPLFSTKKIARLEDFAGIKVRVAAATTGDIMTKLGARPADVTFGEVPTALQTGVIDAVITEYGTAKLLNMGEYVKYMTVWDFGEWSSWSVVVNNQVWDRLPEDLKPLIQDEMLKLENERFDRYSEDALKIREELAKAGVEWVEISPEENERALDPASMKDVYETWYSRGGPEARETAARVAEILERKLPE